MAYKPDKHGRDHCPGGEDPIPPACLGGTTSAYFDRWTWNGTGSSIPDATWTNVVTGVDGANDRWFDEADIDPGGDWDINFGNGSIENNATLAHNFTAWGYVVLDVPDGTLIGAAINWYPSEWQANTGECVDGLKRIEVAAERTPISVGGARLYCYQASGGTVDLQEARLHVRRFEVYEDVYTQTFAT